MLLEYSFKFFVRTKAPALGLIIYGSNSRDESKKFLNLFSSSD